MAESRSKPVVSLYADDPDWDDAIAAFVVALGERVDDLQDAEAAGDTERLRALAESLCDEARHVGYPLLAEAALRVRTSCADPAADARRKAVIDLTELSQRVRRGHRSAAG